MASVHHQATGSIGGERSTGRRSVRSSRVFLAVWLIGTLVNGGLLVAWPAFEQPSPVVGSIAVVLQVAATAALLWWLGPVPVETLAAAPTTRRVALAVAIGLAVLALFPLGAAGLIVLVPVGVAAVVVLVVLRRVGSQRELIAAATFGAVAAAGGLVEATTGAIGVGAAWAQLPLVAVTLLAGWAIAGRVGWFDARIGPSTFLVQGSGRALRDAAFGFALAAPWALGNIANGPFEEDAIGSGWQVLAAFRPGVAEETWARVFVITALYWVLRRYARAGTAVLVAAAVGTYWFAFLHMPGNPVAALAMSLIQILPMTYLWLRRGLETAIGFHVGVDLVRFLAAYLAAQHLWFN